MANEGVCVKCQYENKYDNNFCTNCGTEFVKKHATGPRLVLLDDASNKIFHLGEANNSIGRDISNEVVIEDSQISKNHAVIHFKENRCWIEDLHSKNGIYVNGERVDTEHVLPNGSLVKLGSTIMRLELP